MNATHTTACHFYRNFDGSIEILGTLSKQDCKILNAVAKHLIKFGAASRERLAHCCKLETISVDWALCQLEAVHCKAADLYVLPQPECMD